MGTGDRSNIEYIADAAFCPYHPDVEQLQREIALLRETVAYLRMTNLPVTERLAPVVQRALDAVQGKRNDQPVPGHNSTPL